MHIACFVYYIGTVKWDCILYDTPHTPLEAIATNNTGSLRTLARLRGHERGGLCFAGLPGRRQDGPQERNESISKVSGPGPGALSPAAHGLET